LNQPVIFCSRCGAQNPVNAPKCWRCGTQLALMPVNPPPVPAPIVTPSVPIDHPVTSTPPVATQAEATSRADGKAPKKKRKLGAVGIIFIILGSLMFVGLCVVGVVFLSRFGMNISESVYAPLQSTQQAAELEVKLEEGALASLEPGWLPYSEMGPQLTFEVVKFIGPVQDIADYDYKYDYYFEMGKQPPETEECQNVSYQCGDGQWLAVSDGLKLNSGCKIKITQGKYCHFLLPDGSLLSAFNIGDRYDLVTNDVDMDLIFQINLGAEETRIIQNVTTCESGIMHRLPEGHETAYYVEIGDYEVESLGTGMVTGSPRIGGTLKDVQIEAGVLWGKAKIRRNPKIHPSQQEETLIEAEQSVQTPAYISEYCPYPYVQCGNGCIPRTNTCCPNTEIEGSWCTSRFTQCVRNTGNKQCGVAGLGPMTNNLEHPGPISKWCCEPPVVGYTGSKDVIPGTKFCGLSKLINADEPCCFNGKCGGDTPATLVADKTSNFASNLLWDDLRFYQRIFWWMNTAYQKIKDFKSQDVKSSMLAQLKNVVEEDIAQSVIDHKQFCKTYPGFCDGDDSSGSSSSSSSSGVCSSLPANITVGTCYCGNQSNGNVWCDVSTGESSCYTDSHGMRMCTAGDGQGWIPLECQSQCH
jgi:hypothetical protein